MDATYLSSLIDVTGRLSYLCDDYKVPFLITEGVYDFLTPRVQEFLRKLDCIIMNEVKDPITIYTFDFMREVLKDTEDHIPGDVIVLDESLNIENFKKNIGYMFEIDADIKNFHEGADKLIRLYLDAIEEYLAGSWDLSKGLFKELLQTYPLDGPTNYILKFMERYTNGVPEGWAGYRNIDDEIEEPLPNQDEDNKEDKKITRKATKKSLAEIKELDEEENSSHKPSVIPSLGSKQKATEGKIKETTQDPI